MYICRRLYLVYEHQYLSIAGPCSSLALHLVTSRGDASAFLSLVRSYGKEEDRSRAREGKEKEIVEQDKQQKMKLRDKTQQSEGSNAAIESSAKCDNQTTSASSFLDENQREGSVSKEAGSNTDIGCLEIANLAVSVNCKPDNPFKNSRGFNEEGVYDSKDYRTVYYLVTNKELRNPADIFKRSVMAAILLKLLEQGDYFTESSAPENADVASPTSANNVSVITPLTKEDKYEVGAVLLRHLMNLPCNAHTILLYNYKANDILASRSDEVGSNAFGVLSLFNHSCDPNCTRSSYGTTGVLKSLKFIPKGTELLDCYLSHFALHTRKERQTDMKQQYCFDCNCPACVGDWHRISCGCSECEKKFGQTGLHLLCPSLELEIENCCKCLRGDCPGIMIKLTNACSVCNLCYDLETLQKLSTLKDTESLRLTESELEAKEVLKDDILVEILTSTTTTVSMIQKAILDKLLVQSDIQLEQISERPTRRDIAKHFLDLSFLLSCFLRPPCMSLLRVLEYVKGYYSSLVPCVEVPKKVNK